jgi:hypothetical protein
LRIGAATQSFLNGMDEKTIMANGPWKASCYKRYIRLNMLPAPMRNEWVLNLTGLSPVNAKAFLNIFEN